MEQNGEGGEKVRSPDPFLAVCRPKFVKFLDNAGDHSYFSVPLPDCLCHVSFRRYSPLSVEVVEKPNKCKRLWPPFSPEDDLQLFYSRLLARFTVRRLAKFG